MRLKLQLSDSLIFVQDKYLRGIQARQVGQLEISESTDEAGNSLVVFSFVSLGNRCYLVKNGRDCLIIDPPLSNWRILQYLSEKRLSVSAVFDTHIHNDYISGGFDIAETLGASYFAPSYKSRHVAVANPMQDGQRIEFDSFGLGALHTPGHTLDHHSLILEFNVHQAAMLFSGGSWIRGGLGRVDLDPEESPETLAVMQIESLHKMSGLVQDDTLLLPTHGFGSYCSYGAVESLGSTVGHDRLVNPYLTSANPMARLLDNPLPIPPHFREMSTRNQIEINRSPIRNFHDFFLKTVGSRDADRELLDTRPRRVRLETGEVQAKTLGTDGPFPAWLGWRQDLPDDPMFLVLDEFQAEILSEGLVAIGRPAPNRFITNIGETELTPLGADVIDASQLENWISLEALTTLDLRHGKEWNIGHLRHSTSIPYEDFPFLEGDLVNKAVAVYCGSGYRASLFLSDSEPSVSKRILINGSVSDALSDSDFWCTDAHASRVCGGPRG